MISCSCSCSQHNTEQKKKKGSWRFIKSYLVGLNMWFLIFNYILEKPADHDASANCVFQNQERININIYIVDGCCPAVGPVRNTFSTICFTHFSNFEHIYQMQIRKNLLQKQVRIQNSIYVYTLSDFYSFANNGTLNVKT